MVSSAAISQAVNLCTLQNSRFSAIGERCFSQLETSGLLNQIDADELFLSLVSAELEDDADEQLFQRHQKA